MPLEPPTNDKCLMTNDQKSVPLLHVEHLERALWNMLIISVFKFTLNG